jgi:hypothetical protein
MIRRKGYTRSDGVRVKPTWIQNVGRPGKGPRIFPRLKSGDLKSFGYSNVSKLPVSRRHSILSRASRKIDPLKLFHKLLAISILTKRLPVSKKFKSNAEWVSLKV